MTTREAKKTVAEKLNTTTAKIKTLSPCLWGVYQFQSDGVHYIYYTQSGTIRRAY